MRSSRTMLILFAFSICVTSFANPIFAEDTTTTPKDREASLKVLLSHLDVGTGSSIADIGAGKGRDSWVFAEIVGENGTVYSEEIVDKMVKALKKKAEEDGVKQVRAVLGKTDDPKLPKDSIDVAFMHSVYHHITKPREMLKAIWRSLKPGGHLIIVDQSRGVLRNWVEREKRGPKHYWIAETTVVREAREVGFVFAECPDDLWHKKEPFVLIFQRPEGVQKPGKDPDSFQTFALEEAIGSFLPIEKPYQRPVFIALGESRKLMTPIMEKSSGKALEIILEEWATQKDERPSGPLESPLPSTMTELGDPRLDAEPIDVVFFLDTYHLMFHSDKLLANLQAALVPGGRVYVLDRKAPGPLSRREASHSKMIAPDTVKQEMAKAGFEFEATKPGPAADRFLLVFKKIATN